MTKPWFVLTGGPSTGKTSLLAELEATGYKVVQEAARAVIDEAIASGQTVAELRRDEAAFQMAVLQRKIEVEDSLDPDETIFFDRGMQDTIAYLRANNFTVDDPVHLACRKASYGKVFILEPLPTYEADYARVEDQAFASTIHELLRDAYAQYGMEPVRVPAVSLADRLAFIIDQTR